jgi:hypothetical protein
MTGKRVRRTYLLVARIVVSTLLVCGILLWLVISTLAYLGFADEGTQPGESLSRIVLGEGILALGLVGIVIATVLLWTRRHSKLLCAVALVAGFAQLVVFVSALSLSHFVRSGLVWQTSAWRRLLSDLLLIELFAYYGWVGGIALAVVAAVIGVAVAKLLAGRGVRRAVT